MSQKLFTKSMASVDISATTVSTFARSLAQDDFSSAMGWRRQHGFKIKVGGDALKKRIVMEILLLVCLVSVAVAAPEAEAERMEVPLEMMGKTLYLDAMLYKTTG